MSAYGAYARARAMAAATPSRTRKNPSVVRSPVSHARSYSSTSLVSRLAPFASVRAMSTVATPLVSAAAIRFEAQISVFNPASPDSPCYRCLYGKDAAVDQTCTANGVIAPLLGIMGSMQACEAMKVIMGIGKTLEGRLLLLDALTMEWHTAKLPKDPGCPVCGHQK